MKQLFCQEQHQQPTRQPIDINGVTLLIFCIILSSVIIPIGCNTHQLKSGLSSIVTPKCPIECSCNGVYVDCSNRRLINFPGNISSATKKLNLSFNKLTSWINGTFRSYPDLTHLFLTSNMIEEIVIGMFDGLESLILLDLSNNNINQIDPDSLKPLVKLKELDLSSNALAEVPVAIRKLPLLKEM